MSDLKMPWDETSHGTELPLEQNLSHPTSNAVVQESGTTDGALKYGYGKPVRIIIKGDLKK